MEENRIENEVVKYFDSATVQEKVFYHVQGRPLPRCGFQPIMAEIEQQDVWEMPPERKKKTIAKKAKSLIYFSVLLC